MLKNTSTPNAATPVLSSGLVVGLATSDDDVRDSQRLRHDIFAGEMGACIDSPEPGMDVDRYDEFCLHVIVRDLATSRVVASTRVLTDADARRAGGFYSENEFDLGRFLQDAGPVLEIGRTCVHPGYRSGSAVSLLWSGLARFIDVRRFQYMIGCASLSMADGGAQAHAAFELLSGKYLLSEASRVSPRVPLPPLADVRADVKPALPPLLKAYIRLGARIGGAPCHDPLFNCADLFVVLSPSELQKRYAKHFVERQTARGGSEAVRPA